MHNILQIYYKLLKRAICVLASLAVSLTAAADRVPGLRTLVIDAGHGGHDPGCVSGDGRTYEKDIALYISKAFAKMVSDSCPDVKVILTRSGDKYIKLEDRAAIANRADADLFVSIHINAAVNRSANGYSVHLLGQSSKKNTDLFEYNMNVCKRENSVILLEDDHSTAYEGFDPGDPESYIFMQLMQNAYLEQSMRFAESVKKNLRGGPIGADRGIWQNPILVLWKTAMPAVLVELGFISNSSDLSVLRKNANLDALASRLYKAFVSYKAAYDSSVAIGESPAAPSSEQSATGGPESSDISYGVQIFAGANLLPASSREFLGYRPLIIRSGSIYKYVIGVSDSESGARKEQMDIKTKYPSCFLVKIQNGIISRL